MSDFTKIVRAVSPEKFSEILSASARTARETCFARHGVKASKKNSRVMKPGQKNELRTAALLDVLRQQDDDEMVEEILRSWLLTKRFLLARALDHMGIQHSDGLTESDDVERFKTMKTKEAQTLIAALLEIAPKDDVGIYLKFVGVPKVDELLAKSS